MKKLTLLFMLALCAFKANAQIDTTAIYNNKHEIKLGAIKLLAGGIVEGTYEYIHSPYFTYGASILANLDTDNEYPEDFSITPFARFYFTEPKKYGAKGFFVEGFAKFLTGTNYYYYYGSYYDENGNYIYDDYEEEEKYTTGSVGLALGWKWINHTGFVFEILVGAGNNFGNKAPEASFRGDFNLGYRF